MKSKKDCYIKQTGNGPSRRLAKIQKIKRFLNMQKDNLLPEGIRIRLENHLFPNWKQQKPILFNRKSLKNEKQKTIFDFFSKKISPVSGIVPKTPSRGPFGVS